MYLKVVKRVLHCSLTGGRAEQRENSGTIRRGAGGGRREGRREGNGLRDREWLRVDAGGLPYAHELLNTLARGNIINEPRW